MSLADVKVGETIMVGDFSRAQPAVVGKVGRDWVYTIENHAYSKTSGRARSTNDSARTVADWRRSMQEQIAEGTKVRWYGPATRQGRVTYTGAVLGFVPATTKEETP